MRCRSSRSGVTGRRSKQPLHSSSSSETAQLDDGIVASSIDGEAAHLGRDRLVVSRCRRAGASASLSFASTTRWTSSGYAATRGIRARCRVERVGDGIVGGEGVVRLALLDVGHDPADHIAVGTKAASTPAGNLRTLCSRRKLSGHSSAGPPPSRACWLRLRAWPARAGSSSSSCAPQLAIRHSTRGQPSCLLHGVGAIPTHVVRRGRLAAGAAAPDNHGRALGRRGADLSRTSRPRPGRLRLAPGDVHARRDALDAGTGRPQRARRGRLGRAFRHRHYSPLPRRASGITGVRRRQVRRHAPRGRLFGERRAPSRR